MPSTHKGFNLITLKVMFITKKLSVNSFQLAFEIFADRRSRGHFPTLKAEGMMYGSPKGLCHSDK